MRKATGIVRRLDDLGRIVLPKELRRHLQIRELEPLEIFTNDGEIILRKYSEVGNLADVAKSYCDSVYEALGSAVLVCDLDKIVAVAGYPIRQYLHKPIHNDLRRVIMNVVSKRFIGHANIFDDILADACNSSSIIAPIVLDDRAIGAIVIVDYGLGSKPITDVEDKVAVVAASFIAKQLK